MKCADVPQDFYKSELEIIIHPNYSNSTGANDIALIKLNKPVNLSSSVHPICLPFDDEKVSTNKLQVIGFGATENSPNRRSDFLMKAKVDLFDHEKCRKIYEVTRNLTQNNFCALDVKNFVMQNITQKFDIGTCKGKYLIEKVLLD